ncbi:TBC domain protein [Tieghemostelium lacteum]|uniref:Putative Rab GTPase-activating protein n=1 Tax=Tieghemostelium lacteum TaxID=361077 RepID=G8FUG5_TIELA|nr:putative Rab GTPase-activating protein [Tieghemostelium lacteum]KYQ94223.1 TBC domain protein [Tieghemostelium lacteum]|eukprot:KYQ94223.1 TBC domain protein [Tieghemostelium lacteum]
MSNSNLSDTNSPVKETFWRFSRKTPGIAKPINNPLPHKFEKFNGNIIPTKKKEYDSSAIYNHNTYTPPINSNSNNIANISPKSTDSVNSTNESFLNNSNGLSESHLSLSASPSLNTSTSSTNSNSNNSNEKYNFERVKKFERLYREANVDLEALKVLGWRGVPERLRPMTWKLLLGYLPTNQERREEILERKRKEYKDNLPHYYISEDKRSEADKKTLKQIQMDVPRTNPNVPLFQQNCIQEMLERILYIWAIRHPSSGYVQGINDLATPFISVFLSEYLPEDQDVFNCLVDQMSMDPNTLLMVEADAYWCLTKLLDGIQDHYTFAQPGIQRMIAQLKELLEKINHSLCSHLADQDAKFIEFSFRWMNCLLLREIPFPLVIRMWDTYLCESQGFGVFHVYVCAAFLVLWSDDLKTKDFPDIMIFLQKPPTQNWEDRDIECLFSTAYYYRSLYQNAQSHLKSNNINNNMKKSNS